MQSRHASRRRGVHGIPRRVVRTRRELPNLAWAAGRSTKESHRLTAHPNDAVTDAKVVLEELCAGDPERELACLDDLSCLRERGRENGLCAFLGEVDQVIVRRIVGLARSGAKRP